MPTYNETGSGGILGGGASSNDADQQFYVDGPNKTIRINGGQGEVLVQDIYEFWKEWTLVADNLKYESAMRSTGGDPLPGSEFLGSTFFMVNSWRLRIADNVTITGNVFSDDGFSPFVTLPGILLATNKVSTLVEKVQPPASDNARIFV